MDAGVVCCKGACIVCCLWQMIVCRFIVIKKVPSLGRTRSGVLLVHNVQHCCTKVGSEVSEPVDVYIIICVRHLYYYLFILRLFAISRSMYYAHVKEPIVTTIIKVGLV